MGEIADALIDGEFDFHTGEYIGPGPGYPRTLDRSLPWERNPRQQKQAIEATTRRAETKVYTTLSEKGITGKATRRGMITAFCEKQFTDGIKIDNPDYRDLCFLISTAPGALGEFKQYINNQKQKNKNESGNL